MLALRSSIESSRVGRTCTVAIPQDVAFTELQSLWAARCSQKLIELGSALRVEMGGAFQNGGRVRGSN